MATTSSDAMGGKGNPYPTILQLALVADHPKPEPEWENPKKGKCSRCPKDVWIHDAIRRAMQETRNIAVCSTCVIDEKERQSKT